MDSGKIQFTPLTVFIGSNGSGKSSLIEGLQTFQMIVESGLDKAMKHWGRYENIHNRLRLEQKINSEDETTEHDNIEARASVANYNLAEETGISNGQFPSKMMEFEISRENDFFKMVIDSSASNTFMGREHGKARPMATEKSAATLPIRSPSLTCPAPPAVLAAHEDLFVWHHRRRPWQAKANPKLKDMMVIKRGARLSVQPVGAAEFTEVCRMARAAAQAARADAH